MNEKKRKTFLPILLICFILQIAFAGPAQVFTSQGNRLYEQEKFDDAIKEYDQALIDSPQAIEPKFNKANSYYRLDDLDKAINLYSQVSAESKNMELVAKAKYNLGNCWFQQGSKQRDSNLQKAIENMETAIGHWRNVLDIDPENHKAAKNIEVARLTIKDILDQLKNQQKQQDPNQPQDPNQQQQQQNQQHQGRDPNQQQDTDQQQQQASKAEPNQPEQQESQQQQQVEEKDKEEMQKSDTTAQEILDKEQRDKKQRQIFQKSRYQPVEKDW